MIVFLKHKPYTVMVRSAFWPPSPTSIYVAGRKRTVIQILSFFIVMHFCKFFDNAYLECVGCIFFGWVVPFVGSRLVDANYKVQCVGNYVHEGSWLV